MSAETTATFAVTGAVAGDGSGGAAAVAGLIAARLHDADIVCGDATPIGSGARLVVRLGKRKVPVFVGPAPADSAEAGRWFLSIGSALMPLAKVVGGKDGDARSRLTGALEAALATEPDISAVRWHDDDWLGR